MQNVVSFLPQVVWYLTSNGRDMWCRTPYGFFFSSQEAASAFARSQSEMDLVPIGVDSKELVSQEGLQAMRSLRVTRIFLDPQVDPSTGEVFGKILRVEDVN